MNKKIVLVVTLVVTLAAGPGDGPKHLTAPRLTRNTSSRRRSPRAWPCRIKSKVRSAP